MQGIETRQSRDFLAQLFGNQPHYLVERNSENDQVCFYRLTCPQCHAASRDIPVKFDRADSRLQTNPDTAIPKPALKPTPVQLAERNERDFELKPVAIAKEPIEKYLPRVGDIDVTDTLVQSRYQHSLPEQIDNSTVLSVTDQPTLERFTRSFIAAESQPREPEGKSCFLSNAQESGSEKAASKVKWSGKPARSESRDAAVAIEENQFALPTKQLVDADPSAEVCQVRAAGHADVLTVVHKLARCRILK
jgi:hypothetical protein